MGARRRDIGATPLDRFVRGRRPDRNPLRRGSDRVETAMLALLVIVFLAAAPFAALASGSWTLARAHQAQLAERASSYQVPALVLKLETPSGGGWGDPGAQARWTAHDGTVITSDIAVPLDTAAGSTQWLWTTADGQLTNPPLEDSQVTGQAYFVEGFSVFTFAVLLTVTGLVTRWTLDKRRMAAWEAECARARELVAAAPSLDAAGDRDGRGTFSLRWVLVHLIEEYARHNGHADLLRERIDGATGQ